MSPAAGKLKLVTVGAVFVVAASGAHGKAGAAEFAGAPVNSAAAANVALGQRLASAYGWGSGSQWDCLDTLWTGESAWDQYNTYPSHDTPPSVPGSAITTAYGIPQALPAQKMASAGPDWQTNPATQVRWGLRYVSQTYGSPCAALAFKRASGNQGY